MAGENKDDTKIDVAAITKTVTDQVTQAVTAAMKPQLDELAKNQKIFGDTLAADAKKKEEEQAANKPPVEPKGAPTVPTAEQIAKTINDGIAAAMKQRDESAAATAQGQQIVDKLVKEQLGGNADLGKLLSGGDEKSFAEQAAAISTSMKIKPAIASATGDGGTVPGGKTEPAPLNPNLSPGVAKLAAAYGGPTTAATA